MCQTSTRWTLRRAPRPLWEIPASDSRRLGALDFNAAGSLDAAVNLAGDGGTGADHLAIINKATGAATVTVSSKVIDRLTLHVNFDFDKAAIRDADTAELQKAIGFVKKYQGYKASIEGHTDSRGTERYNQRLSERRAAAVKEHLLKHGVADGARIKSAGYGKSKPIADNSTEKGRFENRRVEILILSE